MPNPYVMLLECIVIFSLITHSVQVRFHLHPNGQKCLRENIHKDVLVSGDYDVQQTPGQNVEIQVTDSSGQILYSKTEVAAGKFLFNTEHNDAYEICFLSKVTPTVRGMKQEVSITTKHGVEAKSYEGLGEAAKLKPMEVELKRLEDLSESIVQDFSFMREREQQMRDTNESTNSRVLYFSLFSLGCLVSLATWQVLYLRKFFKAKKLIE